MIGLGVLRVLSPVSWIAVGGALAAFTLGMTVQGVLKDGKIVKCAAELERAKVAPIVAEVGERARVAPISERATAAAVGGKAEVRWRTRTLVERVRVLVPESPSTRTIAGGDLVPLGALGLLDAAATGVSSEAVTSGLTPERASAVTFARLTEEVIDNYGIAGANAAEHGALVAWEREVGTVP